MRWKAASKYITGAQRRVRRFALFPTRVENAWVWLEHYVSVQEFSAGNWADSADKWIEIARFQEDGQ